ncbi:HAD family hydrolase [Lentisphaerota bacterium WC36G]|nr:HAD family hydrolase [Lentisphaerae bacterium WC36]
MKRKACFLDRDGVVIVDKDYLAHPHEVVLTPNAAQSIKKLNDANYLVIIVSNQSGVARGYFPEDAINDVHERIRFLIDDEAKAVIDKFYYCPHHSKGAVAPYNIDCECRKPKLGMFQQAAQDFNLDIENSIMVGDKLSDIQAGNDFGCIKSFLVKTGHGLESLADYSTKKYPQLKFNVAGDLSEVVDQILRNK